MSKIGRKPIPVRDVQIDIQGQSIHYKGPKDSGIYVLPQELEVTLLDKNLNLKPSLAGVRDRNINRAWGLHRALLAAKVQGASVEFVKQLEIIGLGFKAVLSGKKVTFSLGYSHKIDFDIPDKVSFDIDKTGQKITVKSSDKELAGLVCSKIKAFRLPEPYKGTGIKLSTDVIVRKAGKTKSA